MEPFKNIFNPTLVKKIGDEVKRVDPKFNKRSFEKKVNLKLSSLEMKDRVRLISKEMKSELPANFKEAVSILLKTLTRDKEGKGLNGFAVWPLTQLVEDYGRENFEDSLLALKEMTVCFTSEFAIRPFLQIDEKQVFKYFFDWRDDSNEHVRRWVSEGTRPHLPWGESVAGLFEQPERSIELILPLAYDESEYVRKSVANHLNDISHFNPQLVLKALAQIDQISIDQRRLVKRASRTMLKKSIKKAYRLNGYSGEDKVKCRQFRVTPKKIKDGDDILMKLEVQNTSTKKHKIQLSYVLSFPRLNGKKSLKVFQFKDVELKANEVVTLTKKHSFKKVSIRKHYPGDYELSLRANGKDLAKQKFKMHAG